MTTRQVQLPGGVAAVMRPITAADARWLKLGLQRLSPQSRMRRFLYDKRAYTAAELARFTQFDEARHFALVLALLDGAGREIDAVAVARCFRDERDPEWAEFAITTVDEWQRRGIGTILVQELAACAWAAGIRRWRAVFASANEATRKLLNLVAKLESEHWIATDCIEGIYTLHPPRPSRAPLPPP